MTRVKISVNLTHSVKLCTISYTVYNCPNTEKYRVNKIHIGRGEQLS